MMGYLQGGESFLKKALSPLHPPLAKTFEGKGKIFGEALQESFDQTFSKVRRAQGQSPAKRRFFLLAFSLRLLLAKKKRKTVAVTVRLFEDCTLR